MRTLRGWARASCAAAVAATLLTDLLGSAALGGPRYPDKAWTAAPDLPGWSADRLKAARQYSMTIPTAAVMIVVDGMVLDEWGETARRFNVHSIRKSLLSALYGIAAKEGRVQLGKTLADLGIDDAPPVLSDVEKQATVADLLKARSGVYHAAVYETPGMAYARPARSSYPPGTYWYYNNWDFNALGTILERATGTSIFKQFKTRIADPIGMEDFREEDGSYVRGPQSDHAAYPFRMTARDLARFGLLYLREGRWRDRQIVPREWVDESTRTYSDLGQRGGFGYLWWVAPNGGPHFPSASFKGCVYSAQGAGGHYIVVVPYLRLVVVHRVNTDERRDVSPTQFGHLMQLILNAKQ
jgi:CubicO group peptidase (beta-lactamase class C family)